MGEKIKNVNVRRYFILLIIVLFLKIYKIDLVFGIILDFSSIAIMLIFMKYGKSTAVKIATLACFVSIMFLKGTYLELLQILEVYIIHMMKKKNDKNSILICAIKFWIFIGIPINYFIYLFNNKEILNEYYYFQLMFKFINEIFDVFVSEVIYIYYYQRRISNKNAGLEFKNVIVHILIAAILIPFLLIYL